MLTDGLATQNCPEVLVSVLVRDTKRLVACPNCTPILYLYIQVHKGNWVSGYGQIRNKMCEIQKKNLHIYYD